jgi:ABC-type multidrug transport system fused ATPase/permease subunit
LWLTWSVGQLFESAGHAKRVFEYIDLPSEETEEGKAPTRGDTPLSHGEDLVFSHYTMSYRANTPVILQDLNLRVTRGSKVGLVGRTGAGKTSLVQALFRMVYVRGGDITVGGRSLFELPLEDARELFAIVPQDPYLFEGTVRSNLDRYNEWTEEQLLRVLDLAQLPLPLTLEILEGGSNLSLGERQLLCLARVILTKRPFIIMDEPTSGVDTITDAIMQNVLRTQLADRTIITIAHRLDTLTRMDRIIELRGGSIVRDGPPSSILPLLTDDDLSV